MSGWCLVLSRCQVLRATAKLNEAQHTLESILSEKVEVDKQKYNAMRMISYGTNVHKQQQAEHQAALSALTKQIHMFENTVQVLE